MMSMTIIVKCDNKGRHEIQFPRPERQMTSDIKKTRVRRTPEAARALILDAAKQVFADQGPSKTHLKAVAKVAGVSHSLVTHYFGTVDALVEEVIEAHMLGVKATILDGLSTQPVQAEAILERVFKALSDPLQGRLMAWVLLSGRVDSAEFFAKNTMGLRHIADFFLGSGSTAERRRDLENRLVMLWCATVGYGASASVLWDSLGVEHTPDRDAEFLQLLTESLNARNRLP